MKESCAKHINELTQKSGRRTQVDSSQTDATMKAASFDSTYSMHNVRHVLHVSEQSFDAISSTPK